VFAVAVLGGGRLLADYLESHPGNPEAGLRILISVEGEGVERIARARGKKPGDVVAGLLRDADRSAA